MCDVKVPGWNSRGINVDLFRVGGNDEAQRFAPVSVFL